MDTYVKNINTRIETLFNAHDTLSNVLLWSLDGGKRIRPSMVCDIIKSMRKNVDMEKEYYFIDIALCIEFIHTSSLIVDDLPCMDNDIFRRGKKSVHSQFGEATAQLAAISMLSESFKIVLTGLNVMVKENIFTREVADRIGMNMAGLLADKIGMFGASGGQFIELSMIQNNFKEPSGRKIRLQGNMTVVRDYIDKKTGAFFEIAFALGFFSGGGSIDDLPHILSIARSFGIMYQITDDYEDMNKDLLRDEVTVNFVNIYGYTEAKSIYEKEKTSFIDCMKKSGLYTPFFISLVKALDEKWDVLHKLYTETRKIYRTN